MGKVVAVGATWAVALACAWSPPAVARAAGDATLTERVRFGTSARGRALTASARGPAEAPNVMLVVGCIHGNECAGMAIARRLLVTSPPPATRVWVVPTLNPDGGAARTRQNARGVDLNRNFPRRWRRGGRPFNTFYPGRAAGSEPETRAAMQLVQRIEPDISIWYHQHLRLVVPTGGRPQVFRRYAAVAGLPVRRLPAYRGTATSWQNHHDPGTTAFVVELAAGPLPSAAVARHRRALFAAARAGAQP